jgi:two-component system phosphate regulon sensor histidine kinase PhoR
LVTLVALVAVTSFSTYEFRRFYRDQTHTELTSLAQIVREHVSGPIKRGELVGIDGLCKSLGQASSGRIRITVILPSGKVVGDSEEDPASMSSHSDRPEIIDALQKGYGWSLRISPTLGINMMYVALPLKVGGETAVVVRTAIAATAIDEAVGDLRRKVFWSGAGMAICAGGLSLLISRRITQPIVRMKQIAQRFAGGELDLRIPGAASAELSELAESLNEMARQLHERIGTVTAQRNELEAVLSSMVEGVLAVDAGGRIVSMNKAAAELLGIDRVQSQGRSVEEAIRNVDLLEFVRKTIQTDEPTEGELSLLTEGGTRTFQLHGAGIPRDRAGSSGGVVVLHDMTWVRHLEDVRRDFVANVSHELKTPVTSIQGFVEALLEGGIEDPEKVKRFLKIIAKHSERLNAIIEDLLSLSRLEEDKQRRQMSFDVSPLKPVLVSAIELSDVKAQEKGMTVELMCDDDLQAKINPALLEQAIINLVDNAIKYSPASGKVKISVQKQENQITISVQDRGCGIPPEHLDRVFERFYVVDKGRSRKLGGTGLGLAIVKHIAQAHGGQVSVESTPGVGSTFTIYLPSD